MKTTTPKQKIVLVTLGIGVTFFVLELALRIGGMVFFIQQERLNRASQKSDSEYRILCLGESTTALGGESAYPWQLEEILNSKTTKVRFKVINKGLPARTTTDLLNQLESNIARYRPHAVVTMMGINDTPQYHFSANPFLANLQCFVNDLRVYKLFKLASAHLAARFHHRQDAPGDTQAAHSKEKNGIFQEEESFKTPKEEQWIKALLEKSKEKYAIYEENLRDFQKENRLDEAKAISQRIQKIKMQISKLYSQLAMWYRDRELFDGAGELYKKAIEMDEQNARAFAGLGRVYRSQGKCAQAIVEFERAIAIDPKILWIYFDLGRCYAQEGEYKKAIDSYQAMLGLDQQNYWAYIELGEWLKELKRNDEAEKTFLKAIDINPRNYLAYVKLTEFYRGNARFVSEEELLRKAVLVNPSDEKLLNDLVLCFKHQGKEALAKEYARRAQRATTAKYHPLTVSNYNALAEKVRHHGIKLICMQYPLLDIKPLRHVLRAHKEVIFLENKEKFEDVLETARYNEYFTDSFGGDFGHCTRKGNRLIAENLANAILTQLDLQR